MPLVCQFPFVMPSLQVIFVFLWVSLTSFCGPLNYASSTTALVVVLIGVSLAVWMTLRAMGYSPSFLWSIPSQNIDRSTYWFKMSWVDATSNAAEMIDLKTFGDWPYVNFVRQSMSEPEPASSPYTPISVMDASTSPQPASAVGFRRNIQCECFAVSCNPYSKHNYIVHQYYRGAISN